MTRIDNDIKTMLSLPNGENDHSDEWKSQWKRSHFGRIYFNEVRSLEKWTIFKLVFKYLKYFILIVKYILKLEYICEKWFIGI